MTNSGTVTFNFALVSSGQVGRIEQFDYVNSLMVQAGMIQTQVPADFSISKLAQHFAFCGLVYCDWKYGSGRYRR